MLNEIEESIQAGLEFFHRATALPSPHAITRAYDHLFRREEAGYADVKAVQDLHAELMQHGESKPVPLVSVPCFPLVPR